MHNGRVRALLKFSPTLFFIVREAGDLRPRERFQIFSERGYPRLQLPSSSPAPHSFTKSSLTNLGYRTISTTL